MAVDRQQFIFEAGRVSGDSSATQQFRAGYANGAKTRDLPIAIQEDIPEPVFTLKAGDCHYPAAGHAELARLICPLVERDHSGASFPISITSPNLRRAFYADGRRDKHFLEFDQPVNWDDSLASQVYLDGQSGKVASGVVSGQTITLNLGRQSWSQRQLLRGTNGLAALTFCDVPIQNGKKE